MSQKIYPAIIIFIIGLLFIPSFFGYPPASATKVQKEKNYYNNEAFDVELYEKLQSVDELVNYIDKTFKGDKGSVEFLDHMTRIISSRFYHGYSHYSIKDNWVAALSGQYIWEHLSAIVLPDDILKFPNAACSQQAIVLMECAERFGLDHRIISFDHHFTTEVKVENQWHFVDVNLEVVTLNQSFMDLDNKGMFFSLYKEKIPEQKVASTLGNPKTGAINAPVAERAKTFHYVTNWLSQYLALTLLLLQLMFYYSRFKKTNLTF